MVRELIESLCILLWILGGVIAYAYGDMQAMLYGIISFTIVYIIHRKEINLFIYKLVNMIRDECRGGS